METCCNSCGCFEVPGQARDFSAAMRKASLSCPVVIISILTNEFVGSKRRGLTFDVSPLRQPSLALRAVHRITPGLRCFCAARLGRPGIGLYNAVPTLRSLAFQPSTRFSGAKKARARPHGIVKARRPGLDSDAPSTRPSRGAR